eukprot:COSAG02_NODE_3467_length_6694_cov_3.019409_7_plen_47_part_00
MWYVQGIHLHMHLQHRYNLHMVLRRKAGHFKNIMVLMGLMATVALG